MKLWKVTQSEIHLRTILVRLPNGMNGDDAVDVTLMCHELPQEAEIVEDETEYVDVRDDITACEVEE